MSYPAGHFVELIREYNWPPCMDLDAPAIVESKRWHSENTGRHLICDACGAESWRSPAGLAKASKNGYRCLPCRKRADARALTLDRARELLTYEPHTGRLCWRVARGGKNAGEAVTLNRKAGFAVVRIDMVIYRVHRLAWFLTHGRWAAGHIEHRDGDPHNNRLDNLREVAA